MVKNRNKEATMVKIQYNFVLLNFSPPSYRCFRYFDSVHTIVLSTFHYHTIAFSPPKFVISTFQLIMSLNRLYDGEKSK